MTAQKRLNKVTFIILVLFFVVFYWKVDSLRPLVVVPHSSSSDSRKVNFCEQVAQDGPLNAALERSLLQPESPLSTICKKWKPELRCRIGQPFDSSQGSIEVYDIFLFSFEVDALEIRFHEMNELVDHFVLLESNIDHKGYPKPLLWNILKDDPRFLPFRSKVIHIVREVPLDSVRGDRNKIEWSFEHQSWEKALEFCRFLPSHAIVILGFVDEIVSRQALYESIYCDPRPTYPLSFGIWFPFGHLERAYQSDWPVQDHPYTYGYPSLRYASQCFEGSFRQQFSTHKLGGLHISNYCFPPFVILKELTGTEYGSESFHNMTQEQCQHLVSNCKSSTFGRTVPLDQVPEEDLESIYIPWLIQCNPKRYPALMHQTDSRAIV
ncbi:hypothetical protein GpartN1_g5976.t1 [Galdieria partita]|uniref:Uncharacterized protein n=1 Tax=Galdieria partita TaxID=83374 RepID=A0A9C7UT74_9RHOD|nr:hypothetical protein GpartN1_g5976.t1 [Galdieria partita]